MTYLFWTKRMIVLIKRHILQLQIRKNIYQNNGTQCRSEAIGLYLSPFIFNSVDIE